MKAKIEIKSMVDRTGNRRYTSRYVSTTEDATVAYAWELVDKFRLHGPESYQEYDNIIISFLNDAEQLHQDVGPAVFYFSGHTMRTNYYSNGEPHREDGAAQEFYIWNKDRYSHSSHYFYFKGRYCRDAAEFIDASGYRYPVEGSTRIALDTSTGGLLDVSEEEAFAFSLSDKSEYGRWAVSYFDSLGDLHRTDGPAFVSDTETMWMVHGRPFRSDGGPTLTKSDGAMSWLNKNNDPHRVGGPALVSKYTETWALDGQYHRIDGPALIRRNANGGIVEEQWKVNGQTHRDGGPAMTTQTCIKYMNHGTPHRLDGPAIQWLSDGTEEWAKNGKLHCETGPAVTKIGKSGKKVRQYWLNGIRTTKSHITTLMRGKGLK